MLALTLTHAGFAVKGKARASSEINTKVSLDKQLTGRVTAENGEGLPGANSQIKNTTRGTTSDVNGNYRLILPNQAGTAKS